MTGRYEAPIDEIIEIFTRDDAREEYHNEESDGWEINVRAGEWSIGHNRSEAEQTNRTFERGETIVLKPTRSSAFMQVRDTTEPIGNGTNQTAIIVVSKQGFSLTVFKRVDRTLIDNVEELNRPVQSNDDVVSETVSVNGATTAPADTVAPGADVNFQLDPGAAGDVFVEGSHVLSPADQIAVRVSDPSVVELTDDGGGPYDVHVSYEVNN